MEEVLAWLIPSAAQRPQAPTFYFFLFFLEAIENAGHGIGERQPSCHQSRYGRWLDSRQVENYVNVCSNNKMQ